MIRKIDDFALEPQTDEYPDADKYEWEKSFKGAKTTIIAWGMKGHWVAFFLLGGLECLSIFQDLIV